MADDDEPLEPMVDSELGATQLDAVENSRILRPRRSAAQLQNRHKLAVISKRKKRGIEEDEGILCCDDDEPAGNEDITCTAADVTNSPAVPQAAESTEAAGACMNPSIEVEGKQKKKGKMKGGSTYFPEIGAEKRTDEDWRKYKKPYEGTNVRKF